MIQWLKFMESECWSVRKRSNAPSTPIKEFKKRLEYNSRELFQWHIEKGHDDNDKQKLGFFFFLGR